MSEKPSPVAPVQNVVHTPGPWDKRGGATPGYMCIVDVNSRYIVYEMANVDQVKKDGAIGECVPVSEQAGNARLMALAPEMWKAIQGALRIADLWRPSEDTSEEHWEESRALYMMLSQFEEIARKVV